MAVFTSPIPFSVLTFTTPRNQTYAYIHVPPRTVCSTAPSRYILFLHGWPSIATDFAYQISYLTRPPHNYGIIAPFLLGYYPSSAPTDPALYTLKAISSDIVSLLKHLQIPTPLHAAIGHDWGATLLSRVEYYHPEIVSKLVYLVIGPVPFGQPFDLDSVNSMTKEKLGYEGYGYQKFMIDNTELAVKLMEDNHERMEKLMFAEDSMRLWKEYFGRIGGLKEWLTHGDQDRSVKMIDGVREEDLRRRTETFCPGKDDRHDSSQFGRGYGGPSMWYVAHNQNVNVEDERSARDDWQSYKTDNNVLLVLAGKDPIALPSMQEGMATAYVRDLTKQLRIETLDSGHFIMYEKADQLNKLLEQWLET